MEVVTARKKDPKKVAAGVAGAAARKKNHQILLDEMCNMKTALLMEEAPAPTAVAVAVPERLSTGIGGGMRPLIIIGVVGSGALLLLLAALRLSKRRQVARGRAAETMQLKVERHENIQPTAVGLSQKNTPQRCLFTEFK